MSHTAAPLLNFPPPPSPFPPNPALDQYNYSSHYFHSEISIASRKYVLCEQKMLLWSLSQRRQAPQNSRNGQRRFRRLGQKQHRTQMSTATGNVERKSQKCS